MLKLLHDRLSSEMLKHVKWLCCGEDIEVEAMRHDPTTKGVNTQTSKN